MGPWYRDAVSWPDQRFDVLEGKSCHLGIQLTGGEEGREKGNPCADNLTIGWKAILFQLHQLFWSSVWLTSAAKLACQSLGINKYLANNPFGIHQEVAYSNEEQSCLPLGSVVQ